MIELIMFWYFTLLQDWGLLFKMQQLLSVSQTMFSINSQWISSTFMVARRFRLFQITYYLPMLQIRWWSQSMITFFLRGFIFTRNFCTRAVFMKMKYKFVVICFNIVVFWKYLFTWSVLSFFVLSRELVFLDTVPSQKAHTLYVRFFSNRVFGIAPKNYNFF